MSKWERLILYPLLAISFIIFSFYDYQVSSSFVLQGGSFLVFYGRFFSLVAEIPFQLLLVFSFVILFRFRPRSSKAGTIGLGILFALAAIASAGYGGYVYYAHMKEWMDKTSQFMVFMKFGGTAIIGVVYLAIAALVVYLLLPDAKGKHYAAWAYKAIIIFATMAVGMQLLKMLWGRPRYFFLMTLDDPEGNFSPWWLLHPTYHLTDDSHFSFPSGHTMFALSILVFSLFPFGDKPSAKRSFYLRLAVYVWGLLTAIGRIEIGAHFGTDVTMGYFLGLLAYDLYSSHLYPRIETKVVGAPQEE
jgi:membrane-associated phospholipid phosphatase